MGPESGPKNWSPFLGFNRNPIKTKFKVPKMGPFLGPVFGTIFGPIFGIFVFFSDLFRIRFWGPLNLPGHRQKEFAVHVALGLGLFPLWFW